MAITGTAKTITFGNKFMDDLFEQAMRNKSTPRPGFRTKSVKRQRKGNQPRLTAKQQEELYHARQQMRLTHFQELAARVQEENRPLDLYGDRHVHVPFPEVGEDGDKHVQIENCPLDLTNYREF